MVLAGTLCGAAGAVVFGLSPGWAGLLVGRVLMGLGMAPVLMGSFKLIAGWFPAASFGGLSGLMLGLGTLGSLVAATPLAALVGWIGWRGSFVGFGLATLAERYRLELREGRVTREHADALAAIQAAADGLVRNPNEELLLEALLLRLPEVVSSG